MQPAVGVSPPRILSDCPTGLTPTPIAGTQMPIPPPRTSLPWNTDTCHLDSKITQVLIHGFEGNRDHCMRVASPAYVHATTNLQIEIVTAVTLRTICEEWIRIGERTEKMNPLPPTLLVQSDRWAACHDERFL